MKLPIQVFLLSILAGVALGAETLPDHPATAYLFAYFTGNGEDGLHLAWSDDGREWNTLKAGKSFLQPAIGESRLMRDPFICQTPDGVFHLVWTAGWKGTSIGYCRSSNLIDWDQQLEVPVMADVAGTINCWAPEMVYDPVKKQFLIFWASTVAGHPAPEADQSEEGYNHRIYSTTTSDFRRFQPPSIYFNPGFNCIDSTLVHLGDRWAMVFKDERLNPEMKNLRIAWSKSLYGPFSDISEPFTPSWVEGPTVLEHGKEWIIYFDEYSRHQYGALRTKDFTRFEPLESALSMPRGARHGTVITVDREILEGLLSLEMERPAPISDRRKTSNLRSVAKSKGRR